MKLITSSILVLASCLIPSSLTAKDAAGSKDHPALKRIEGSEIIWSKTAKFDEYAIPLEQVQFDYDKQDFKPTRTEKTEGARTILYYKLPGETTTLEAVKQYETDLGPGGFETLFTAANDKLDDGYNRFVSQTFPTVRSIKGMEYLHQFNHDEQRFMVLKGTGKSGNPMYVTLYAFVLQDVSGGLNDFKEAHQLDKGQTILRVDVLETKAMDSRMTVVKASEITSSIERTGRIAIYGVLFDTGKADLKPESADSLTEMAAAIKATPGKKYLITGHTDNVGDFALNQALSQNRAAAVTAALAKTYGVPVASMIPVGVGMAAPTASNADEAGRAKNRRVEIVAM